MHFHRLITAAAVAMILAACQTAAPYKAVGPPANPSTTAANSASVAALIEAEEAKARQTHETAVRAAKAREARRLGNVLTEEQVELLAKADQEDATYSTRQAVVSKEFGANEARCRYETMAAFVGAAREHSLYDIINNNFQQDRLYRACLDAVQ